MDRTALYLTTLLMLIMTSSALEELALSEKKSVRNRQSPPSSPRLGPINSQSHSIENRINVSGLEETLPIVRSSEWIEHPGWYQQGQYMFPDRNGCGGNITAKGDYDYGSLTSPNWPQPLPSQTECTWRLHGFNNLFFVFSGRNSHHTDRGVGTLTVKINGKINETIYISGDFLHRRVFLNLQHKMIWLTITTHLMDDIDTQSIRAKLTWWTVPAPNTAFVTIFNTHLSEGNKFGSTQQLDVEKGKTTGYVFLFKSDISTYNVVIGMIAMRNEATFSCSRDMSIYIISYNEKVKSPGRPRCDPATRKLTLAAMGYNQSTSTPLGIEINIPIGVSHVFMSINAELARDTPAYISGQDCLSAFNTSMKNGLGYYGTANFTAANNTYVNYKAGLRCDLNVSVPMPILDSFFQVQTQTDIQLSPSCVADFLQIGGQRVCGVNNPDTYISSPVDNSLIERTGTYYINILQTTTPVFASPSVSDKHNASLALNPDPYQCYVSDPGVSSPFWVVDMADVFNVQGVRIVAEQVEKGNVTVVVYINAKAKPWPEQYYQTCWSGLLTSHSELVSCFRQVSGRYLAIFKESVNLTLCKVEVFVNIAAPLVTWRNVAYGKNIMNIDYPRASYDTVADGYANTCKTYGRESCLPHFYNISLGNHKFTVQAVRLYGRSVEPLIRFVIKSSEQRCVVYEGPIDSMGILVSCTIPMVTNHVFIARLMNLFELCEVIIYADVNDKTNANAALYTKATKHFRSHSQQGSAPKIVDGILTSCESASDEFIVELRGLHVVEGVILNLGDDQQKTVLVRLLVYPFIDSAAHLCHDKAYTDTEVLHLLCSLPIVGSRLNLQTHENHDSGLHLCELQVIATPYDKEKGLQNVALFKHVRQGPRSTSPSARFALHVIYYGQGARLAVDGDRSNNNTNLTCTTVLGDGHTAAWWEVDLANMYRVNAVGLFLCPGVNNKYHIYIRVSDGRAGSQQLCYKGPPRDLVNCTESILGRYVRLQSIQDLCLCEVEVMAAPLTIFERFGERPRHVKDSLFDLFTFVTDGRLEKREFSTWYKIDNLKHFNSFVDCGELVRKHHSTLYSPSYPDSYALVNDSYICHWMVYTPYDSFTLVYIDYLNLSRPVSEDLCFHDVLIFSNSAGQQITMCGFIKNQILNMKSYQNGYLHITLMVRKYNTPENNSVPGRGSMRLHFLTYPNCIYNDTKVDPDKVGTLSSPLYPAQPPPYAWCRWILEAKVMGTMELIFLEWNSAPMYSYPERGCHTEVLISSRHSRTRRFCPNNPPKSDLKIGLQLEDRVTIIFKTTQHVRGRGFLLQYRLIPYSHGHDQVLGFVGKVFQSFCYPENYDTKNITLRWAFKSRRDFGTIILKFTDLLVGGGNFTVRNSITLDSGERIQILNSAVYSNITSEPLRYPVYPYTVFELAFIPSGKGGRFEFTFDFVPDAPRVLLPEACAAEQPYRVQTFVKTYLRFSKMRLQENILVVDNQTFFVMETGLYVVSMRVVFSIMELQLNNIKALTNREFPGIRDSLTATLKLDKGDMLNVVVYSLYAEIHEDTAFSVVYVSPIEGGYAFAGYQKEHSFDCSYSDMCVMRFDKMLTLVPEKYDLMYNAFTTPFTGIYWVTLRSAQLLPTTVRPSGSFRFNLYKGQSRTFLETFGRGQAPASVSAAVHCVKGDVLRVMKTYGSSSSNESFFSIVYLFKNIKLYTQTADHIAFTGLLGECVWIGSRFAVLLFNSVQVDYGEMRLNTSTLVAPTSGLYIISIRHGPMSTQGCQEQSRKPEQYLMINVNRRQVVSTYSTYSPTDYVTVLRLNKSDMLTVKAVGDDNFVKDTLFSIAFVDL